MKAELKQVIAHLNAEALPVFAEEFGKHQEDLAKGGIEAFHNFAMDLITKAHYELCNFFCVKDLSEFSLETHEKVWHNTIKMMNGALPVEHQYILCLVKQEGEPIDFMALYRQHDAVLADSISRDIVPVKYLRDDEDPETQGKMEYIYPPDSLRSNSF